MSSFDRQSIRPCRLSSSLLLGITLLFPLQLFGEEQSSEQLQQPDIFNPIDAPRDYLSGQLINFTSGIDRFFGDDRNYQESNQSVFQLDLVRVTGYGGDRKIVLSGRAKVNLPSTEKRLHLMLETNPDKNITGEPTQTQATPINQVAAPESYAASVRYEKEKEEDRPWHFSTDAGIKFQGINTDPFVRARGSYSVPMGQWRLKAAESVFWFNTIGAGESTQLDLEHFLSEPVLFRATSNATWLNDKQNFDLRQDLSVYHTLNDRTALLYQASAIGISNPQFQVTDYVALLLYRYRLHRSWIFFELSPQLHFPKERNYQSSPTFSMRLEMLFDESK